MYFFNFTFKLSPLQRSPWRYIEKALLAPEYYTWTTKEGDFQEWIQFHLCFSTAAVPFSFEKATEEKSKHICSKRSG